MPWISRPPRARARPRPRSSAGRGRSASRSRRAATAGERRRSSPALRAGDEASGGESLRRIEHASATTSRAVRATPPAAGRGCAAQAPCDPGCQPPMLARRRSRTAVWRLRAIRKDVGVRGLGYRAHASRPGWRRRFRRGLHHRGLFPPLALAGRARATCVGLHPPASISGSGRSSGHSRTAGRAYSL